MKRVNRNGDIANCSGQVFLLRIARHLIFTTRRNLANAREARRSGIDSRKVSGLVEGPRCADDIRLLVFAWRGLVAKKARAINGRSLAETELRSGFLYLDSSDSAVRSLAGSHSGQRLKSVRSCLRCLPHVECVQPVVTSLATAGWLGLPARVPVGTGSPSLRGRSPSKSLDNHSAGSQDRKESVGPLPPPGRNTDCERRSGRFVLLSCIQPLVEWLLTTTTAFPVIQFFSNTS